MSVDHAARAHALLSASAAKQWMNCTPSIRASSGVSESTSVHAEEGTFAHELSELHFALMHEDMTKRKFNTELKNRKQNQFYNEELHEYVMEYVGIVEERINEAKSRSDLAPVLMFETKLDLSSYVPESFGTGDVIIYSGGILEIIDLKFGKGVEVSAIDNPQLRLYALGAYEMLSPIYDINEVIMTIVQPRIDNFSSQHMIVEDLIEWGINEVKPKAELAFKGEGEFNPGEHCRWCKIRHRCKARADFNLKKVEKMDEPFLLTDEQLADLLFQTQEIQKWAKDIESYCLDQAVNHDRTFEGWKLVEGRSARRYSDEGEILTILKQNNFKAEDITESKVLTISKLEKAIGKTTVKDLVGHLIIKPPGKATLAPESDKRPAIGAQSAQDEFDVIGE